MNEKRPNLLFLMVDQLRPDHAGFMPEAVFSTPNLKALGEGATVFQQCQSVNPICMPARSCLHTGRYSRQIGALAMSGDLPRDIPTVPAALQTAGYWTSLVGKLHVMQTWRWETPRGEGLNLLDLNSEIADMLGYDYLWESAGKQLALKNHCHWCQHLEEKGILEEVRDYVDAAGANHNVPSGELQYDGKPWPFPEEDHVDVVTGEKALEALRKRPKDQPFALTVSFCSPHKPFDPPQRYLDEMPEPSQAEFIPGPGGETPSEEMTRTLLRLQRAYRGTIALIDDQVGRIVQELKEQGEWDNTIVMFTTDHGEMMGDHYRVQKDIFWRQSLTVPTLVRDPLHPVTQVVSDPVEITDLCATQLDAAGLDPEAALSEDWPAFRNLIPCRSLLPAVREGEAIREFSFSESRSGWQCVQSRHRKYVRLPAGDVSGPKELFFDVDQDPDERHNLADDLSEQDEIRRHRDHLLYVLTTFNPLQTLWAPLSGSGQSNS